MNKNWGFRERGDEITSLCGRSIGSCGGAAVPEDNLQETTKKTKTNQIRESLEERDQGYRGKKERERQRALTSERLTRMREIERA